MSNEISRAVHGGDSFGAIGVDFQNLRNRENVYDYDVLDAWYPPSPAAVAAIHENLEWLVRTSPPTHGEGLIEEISRSRNVKADHLVLGAGSSSLIFSGLDSILKAGDKVVVFDPTYGEFAHVAGSLIGALITPCPLDPKQSFVPDLDQTVDLSRNAQLLVLVNPNSPTGVPLSKAQILSLRERIPASCTIWVDETYIDFYDSSESLETEVSTTPGLIVSKSMSKYYGLSGLRVGYLVCNPDLSRRLNEQSPPWNVGLISQLAAVYSLRDTSYYVARTAETRVERENVIQRLAGMGLDVVPSSTNFVMFGTAGRSASEIVTRLHEKNVFIRLCDSLFAGRTYQDHFLRMAVKEPHRNAHVLECIEQVLA